MYFYAYRCKQSMLYSQYYLVEHLLLNTVLNFINFHFRGKT